MKNFLLIISIFTQFALFAQDFNVRGYVYDQSNGDAVSFQKVKLLRKDSTILAGAITDLNGLFSIPKLALGEYIVKVDNQAYELFTTNISFKEGKKILDLTKKQNEQK